MVAQIFVTTVGSRRVMRGKDSFMSFRLDSPIAVYRHIFLLQVITHNTIQAKIFRMLTLIWLYGKEISLQSRDDIKFTFEIFHFLGFYAAYNGNCVPAFRDNISVHLEGSNILLGLLDT